MKCKWLVGLALLTLVSAFSVDAFPVEASSVTVKPPPACQGAPYRAFDFWLGEWEVHIADGREAGRNSIRAQEQGCVLVERWRSVRGGTGQSINFYDPVSALWRQVWVSPGVIIDVEGGISNGSMVLEGHITYTSQGQRQRFRGTWTPLEDGRVRQFFEQRETPQDEWQPWFEGFYTRRSDVDNGG